MADNLKVLPSTDPSAKPVATRQLTVGGVPTVDVAYGLVGIESAGALVPVDATHGLPVAILAGTAIIGHVIVDSVGGTVAVSAASLPLPAGAATAAKQPALGTAGVASADVLTVQGIASMTPLKVDGSAATQPVSGTITANAGTGTFTVSGSVNAVQSGTWNVGTVSLVTTVTGVTTVSTVTSLSQWAGNAIDTNSGIKSAGTLRVVLATDQPSLTNSMPVATPAATTGGATPYHYIAAASANQDSQSVKGSAGTLYTIALGNVNAAVRFVKLYDKATAPTSGDTPVLTLIVPGATTGAGSNVPIPACGIAFASGIGFRITTAISDGDTGAATSGDVTVNVIFK
jgi:hypothetical protein